MTPDTIFEEFRRGFNGRKFTAGLLVAFIDMWRELGIPDTKAKTFEDVTSIFEKQERTNRGSRANTLIVMKPDGRTLSLRPFYNAIETFFRAEHKRFDYPSCAPHATQAWGDYIGWLDALTNMTEKELLELRERVCNFVLDTLASQEFDPGSVTIEPPIFKHILKNFDVTAQRGEPTGAAYQGIVFGFLRADNPHLQIEIDKVRTGSRRLQRVGDIDCWEGARLAITAEVKQYVLNADTVPDLAAFANEGKRRGALAVVAALGFEDGVREAISELGARPVDVHDLEEIVELWDPVKQRIAVTSLEYYAKHVEKNSKLSDRLNKFVADIYTQAEDGAANETA